jgi:hypothetical protein
MPGNLYQYVPKALQGSVPPKGMEDIEGITSHGLRNAIARGYNTDQILYEYDRRNSTVDTASNIQLADLGLNTFGNGVDIVANYAGPASKAANLSAKLSKLNPYLNTGVNLIQGGLTTASGVNPYGGFEDAPMSVAAYDVADSTPAMIGAYIAGPVGMAVGQTLLGGQASRERMISQANMNRPVWTNNPSEDQLIGYSSPDWNRNMFNQVATSGLNSEMARRQALFEKRYMAGRAAKLPELTMKNRRNIHGQLLADYDDAQIDQNWMQKAYYAIKLMAEGEGGPAFDDFLQRSRDNRAQENAIRKLSSDIYFAENPRSRFDKTKDIP